MIAKERFWIIIVYMETNNSSKLTAKYSPSRMVQMADLLSKYFFVYFLPREVRHTESKKYLYYKSDSVFTRPYVKSHSTSSNRKPKDVNKVFEVLKKYINDDCTEFNVLEFVDKEESFFNLLPPEIKGVDKGLLSEMVEDAKKHVDYVSFVKICLEKLFDSRFQEKFNEKTDDFLKKEEDRYRKEKNLKEFYKVDIVRDFLECYSASYTFDVKNDDDIPYWGFKEYGKEIIQRRDDGGTEIVDNLFSGYKLYGQGEYSKLLIAFRRNSNKSLNELKKEGIKPILEDDVKIGESEKALSINDFFNNQKKRITEWQKNWGKNEYKLENVVGIPIEIGKLLCKRFNDFIPLELDGKYNKEHPNKTLREEIFELCKYSANKRPQKLPWDSSQCNTIKELFIKLLNTHGVEKCKEITKNKLFYDYCFESLNTKDSLKRHKISILTLFRVLEKFDDKGYIRDGRSNDKPLQAFEEIKKSYLVHCTMEEYCRVLRKDGTKGKEISVFDKVEEKNNDYKREYETEYEEIDDENVAPFSFLQRKIEFLFQNIIVLQDDLKRFLRIHNRSVDILVYDPSEKNKYEKIDIVKRAIKKLCRNYDSKIESFFNKKTEDGKKIVLCRYKHHASERNGTYSLETVLNIDDTLMEKIWFAIFLEDLKGDERNPWRRLTNNCYLNEIPEDERKAVGDSIKQSMKNIYESFLKSDF